MNSVRIEPADDKVLLVDVVCDCTRNGLVDSRTGVSSFKHIVQITGSPAGSFNLSCTCGKVYEVRIQGTHIHVGNM